MTLQKQTSEDTAEKNGTWQEKMWDFLVKNTELFRRIGHFAWYSNHTMSQWVKLRGEFAAYSFVSQQMALYLCIAV